MPDLPLWEGTGFFISSSLYKKEKAMRTWNCVHGYAALILAAALIMTACGDAESGPGGGGGGGGSGGVGGDPPPPPPAAVSFTIVRADYLDTTTVQDFIFRVDGLTEDPTYVKVEGVGVTPGRVGNKITLGSTSGLDANTLSDIEVEVDGETGTLKGMLTYDDATKNKDKYTDLLIVINRGLGALNTAGSPAYLGMSDIRDDVIDELNDTNWTTLNDDVIELYFTSNNMPTYGQPWADGIDLAMQTILANYATILADGGLSGELQADLKARLIRIYMNKTNPNNDDALKTILGTDIQTADTTSLSMLPPKGRREAPGAGLA
jgi:hypothetical protein